ncbi:MAG: FAD-dependent oxidoreductase [Thermoanaerobaculia bacterium]|nr:FAD-dependent oxidoreductase [Thermoanaerobaculia bacterium]
MSTEQGTAGPDLTAGVALDALPIEGSLVGHVGDENVLVVRRGNEVFAVTNRCSHYGGPLSDGLLVDDTVRCPWHHACFSLRTGEALAAPAFLPIATWSVAIEQGRLYVRSPRPAPARARSTHGPESVVIVGGGAAGHMAAETLRKEGYSGPVTLVSADPSAPYDRPNLSKDYLAGSAPEEWIPLRDETFYRENEIELRLDARVERIDPSRKCVILAGGDELEFGALLLATGSQPVRLDLPGGERVAYLRSLADSRAIIARAAGAARVVVIGASFIGLEVAASLRARELDVTVTAPDAVPLARTFGDEVGRFIRSLHEDHGVRFRLGDQVTKIGARSVKLSSGEELAADLVVAGIGVRPNVELAKDCGAQLDRGVVVDEFLKTSIPGIFAAGDIARWPDPHSGESIRVEHWVVAQRQGQVAARNMMGQRQKFDAVPFFWSAHYDVVLAYVGHASSWDRAELTGDLAARDARVDYFRDGRLLAVATLFRDRESLELEAGMERRVREGGFANPRP